MLRVLIIRMSEVFFHEMTKGASQFVDILFNRDVFFWLWRRSTCTTWCLHASLWLLLLERRICLHDFVFIMNTQHEMFSLSRLSLILTVDKRNTVLTVAGAGSGRLCNWIIYLCWVIHDEFIEEKDKIWFSITLDCQPPTEILLRTCSWRIDWALHAGAWLGNYVINVWGIGSIQTFRKIPLNLFSLWVENKSPFSA